MNFADLTLKVILRLYAEKFVGMTYRGLLSRDADSSGLAAYSKMLKRAGDLTPLLEEIARSDEQWHKTLETRAPELVRALYLGLLGREPEPEALESNAQKLAESHDLTPLLEEIARSDELWGKLFAAHASQITAAMYRSVLQREPDPSGLETYTKIISAGPGGLEKALKTILASDEFATKSYKKDLETHYWSDRVKAIDDLYFRYYGRGCSNKELASHISKDEPIWKIHRSLISGKRCINNNQKILIFGAYGNGNMGDAYQALAVRAHLKSAWKISDSSIYACSLLRTSDYPFPEDQKLPPEAIYDSNVINSFDFLVIGGGGLLVHPHDPLRNDEWVKKLRVPIILFGVGANREKINEHKTLLENAIYVSGRDEVSVSALKGTRKDALYVPDPILTISSIDALTEFDPPACKFCGESIDFLWVLKYPSNESDADLLRQIRSIIRKDEKKHLIIAIEPVLDAVLNEIFTEEEIIYVKSLSDLLVFVDAAKTVFSMRYHGVIFSLLRGKNTFGASQTKILDLFKELGSSSAYITTDLSPVYGAGATLNEGSRLRLREHGANVLRELYCHAV